MSCNANVIKDSIQIRLSDGHKKKKLILVNWMTISKMKYQIGISVILMLSIQTISSESEALCKWSNEGCSSDEECCSGDCLQAHKGTNYRCTRSSISERCIFDYHCKSDLMCGAQYHCCSPYWQLCVRDQDCCESYHVCRPAKGFIYNRCLFPASACNTKVSFTLLFTIVVNYISNQL